MGHTSFPSFLRNGKVLSSPPWSTALRKSNSFLRDKVQECIQLEGIPFSPPFSLISFSFSIFSGHALPLSTLYLSSLLFYVPCSKATESGHHPTQWSSQIPDTKEPKGKGARANWGFHIRDIPGFWDIWTSRPSRRSDQGRYPTRVPDYVETKAQSSERLTNLDPCLPRDPSD